MSTVRVRVSESERTFSVGAAESGNTFQTGMETHFFNAEDYEGSYAVTPSGQTQTLATNGKRLDADVTVGAIPSGWGRVAQSGSVLTIS